MVGGAAEMIRLCGRTKHDQADSRRTGVRLFTQPVRDRMDEALRMGRQEAGGSVVEPTADAAVGAWYVLICPSK